MKLHLALLSGLIPIVAGIVVVHLLPRSASRVRLGWAITLFTLAATLFMSSGISFSEDAFDHATFFLTCFAVTVGLYLIGRSWFIKNPFATHMVSILLGLITSFASVMSVAFSNTGTPEVLSGAGRSGDYVVRIYPLGHAVADYRGTGVEVSRELGPGGLFEKKVIDTSYYWMIKSMSNDPGYVFAPRDPEIQYDSKRNALFLSGVGHVFNPEAESGVDSVEWRDTLFLSRG